MGEGKIWVIRIVSLMCSCDTSEAPQRAVRAVIPKDMNLWYANNYCKEKIVNGIIHQEDPGGSPETGVVEVVFKSERN